jgi:hypothetical protein
MAEISPLRRRMIKDMTIRNLSPATQQSVPQRQFSRHFGRSTDRVGLKDVHAFQVHLVATGISWPALSQIVCAHRLAARSAEAMAVSRPRRRASACTQRIARRLRPQ